MGQIAHSDTALLLTSLMSKTTRRRRRTSEVMTMSMTTRMRRKTWEGMTLMKTFSDSGNKGESGVFSDKSSGRLGHIACQ